MIGSTVHFTDSAFESRHNDSWLLPAARADATVAMQRCAVISGGPLAIGTGNGAGNDGLRAIHACSHHTEPAAAAGHVGRTSVAAFRTTDYVFGIALRAGGGRTIRPTNTPVRPGNRPIVAICESRLRIERRSSSVMHGCDCLGRTRDATFRCRSASILPTSLSH